MSNIIDEKKEAKQLLILSILAGRIMLKNGAETYRVEDTIVRICKSRKNIKYVESFVTPTGIFVSLEYGEDVMSYLQRINTIKIDLNKIDMVNNFSRNFVESNMSIEDGLKELRKIDNVSTYHNITKLLFGSVAGAFFSILFGASFLDFISAFIVSLLVLLTTIYLNKLEITFFIDNLIAAAVATISSILLVKIGLGKNMDTIIIGSIMTLVPGVAITNAIRDTMSGDFISGLSRGMEAVVIALAIAFGVGIILNSYFKGLI